MLLEAEMSHHQEALTTATETSRGQINKLQEDKAVLEVVVVFKSCTMISH